MKKLLFIIGAFIMFGYGCAGMSQNKASVGLVIRSTQNPYFKSLQEGAQASAKDNRVNLQTMEVADGDIGAQITAIRKFIDLKPEVLLITPIGSTDIIPAVKEAQAAGIKVIAVDNMLDRNAAHAQKLEMVPFVTVNNLQGAYLAAKFMVRDIAKPANAVIVCGDPLAQNNNARISGIMRAYSENDNVKLVAVATAGWNRDKAYHVISELFKKYPDIAVVYATNDIMALGVSDFIKKHNLNHVRIGGFDAIQEAVDAVEKGDMFVTVDQVPHLIGYTAVSQAKRLASGQFVPESIEVTYKIITKGAQ